jgi:hypothetical protein
MILPLNRICSMGPVAKKRGESGREGGGERGREGGGVVC